MSNINIDFVKDSIDDITQIRRDIHAHPEMAFKEFRTSKLVQEKLDSYGIETHYGLAGTGVVGTLHGQAGEGLTIVPKTLEHLRSQEVIYIPFENDLLTSPIIMSVRHFDKSELLKTLLEVTYQFYDIEGFDYKPEQI